MGKTLQIGFTNGKGRNVWLPQNTAAPVGLYKVRQGRSNARTVVWYTVGEHGEQVAHGLTVFENLKRAWFRRGDVAKSEPEYALDVDKLTDSTWARICELVPKKA